MPDRKSKPLTITLPDKMAKAVKARVASGEYASESEVIREGLRAMEEREAIYEAALEQWLRTDVRERAADYEAGRSKLVPANEAFARVRKRLAKRPAKK